MTTTTLELNERKGAKVKLFKFISLPNLAHII
ncbi:hypothetical protein ABIB39_003536 [Mucilaginibacter sp. UYP27]